EAVVLAATERDTGILRAPIAQATALLGPVPAPAFHAALAGLADLALAWPNGTEVEVVPAVRDVLGPHPAGLGRRAADLLKPGPTLSALQDPDELGRRLAACTADERAILQRLAGTTPAEAVPALADPCPSAAVAPVRNLIER